MARKKKIEAVEEPKEIERVNGIIVDVEELGIRSDEVEVVNKKQNQLMRDTIVKIKNIIREQNLTSLTAPQIGEKMRVMVINFNGDLRSFVNPIITKAKGLELSREKCSSLPNREFIRPRNNDISVMYMTPLGKIESKRLVGMAARVFQHAIDHLDGLLLEDVGLEIDSQFDEATQEERDELLKAYMDSLDIKQKDIEKAISEDDTLKKTYSAIEFMTKLQKGEVEVSHERTDDMTDFSKDKG